MMKQRIQAALLSSIFLVLIGCSFEEVSETKPGAFQQQYWVEDYVTQLRRLLIAGSLCEEKYIFLADSSNRCGLDVVDEHGPFYGVYNFDALSGDSRFEDVLNRGIILAVSTFAQQQSVFSGNFRNAFKVIRRDSLERESCITIGYASRIRREMQ